LFSLTGAWAGFLAGAALLLDPNMPKRDENIPPEPYGFAYFLKSEASELKS
jgi:hypothetical protein